MEIQSMQEGGVNITEANTCGTMNTTRSRGVESTQGQPGWTMASGIKKTKKTESSNGDREQSWSGGVVLVRTGWDEVGRGSTINSRQGGVFTDSWKALGCQTGTCQMQLLLWLIDRVCIPPWWETGVTSQCWEGLCQIQKEKEKL